MFVAVFADIPFGIDPIKILLHLLNFAILMVGLTFLLYKPILKFIQQRQKSIEEGFEEGKRMQEEAQEKAAEYQAKLAEADGEAQAIVDAAKADAEKEAKNILAEAKEQADLIKEQAEAKAQEQQRAAMNEVKDQIAEVVVSLTEELVEREISKEDNERIIEKRLQEWKGEGK